MAHVNASIKKERERERNMMISPFLKNTNEEWGGTELISHSAARLLQEVSGVRNRVMELTIMIWGG